MRTRDEQIDSLYHGHNRYSTITQDAFRNHLIEAERRAEERVRAEIGVETLRLDWWEKYLPDVTLTFTHEGRSYAMRWSAKSKKRGHGKTLRAAIDDAREKSGCVA